MKVCIKHNKTIVARNILVADSLLSRMIGLMFKKHPPGEADGILLEPCNSIHTFFMKYAIDVVFLSSRNEVIKVIRELRPWRLTWIYFNASKTLELPAGKLPLYVTEGQVMEVEDV